VLFSNESHGRLKCLPPNSTWSVQCKEGFGQFCLCGVSPPLYLHNHKKLVWLGTTNNDGPGSIWSLDGGPQLQTRALEVFGTQTALDTAIAAGPKQGNNPCSVTQMPKWAVGVDAPISIKGIGNVEVTASLSHNVTITATATSVSWVSISTNDIEKAINRLHSDRIFSKAADGRSFAAVSAFSVQGLQITYTLTSLHYS